MVRRAGLIVVLLIGLPFLSGCLFDGVRPKPIWNDVQVYDAGTFVLITGTIANEGSGDLGIGAVVAYALDGSDNVIAQDDSPIATLISKYEAADFSCMFYKTDIVDAITFRLIIVNSPTDPFNPAYATNWTYTIDNPLN